MFILEELLAIKSKDIHSFLMVINFHPSL